MASSTLFRGRRIVDPVPVQRGPSPRDGKYQSSFSDLAAAWENVGEAKSALQAAEARIKEANAGLRENEGLDTPMEEVFSETQRYGRVARYELRPSHFGQDVTSVSGRNNSRRSNDFRMNTNRQELPSRAPVHTSLLSPPSKDIHAEHQNGPMSRNPLPAFPSYPSDSGLREPGAATSYSSIHRTSEPLGRRSPVRFQGLSSIPTASSFEDSLEVGGTSRLSRNESRPTSSLGLRPVIANKSDALTRLKERIKLQKERLSPTGSANGNSSSNSSPPPDVPSADAVAAEPYRSDIDLPARAAISKRKVASAPAAPAYKGFSEVESKATTSSEANRKVKVKGFTADGMTANSANLRPQKPLQKKAPPKIQRVIAPRRPTDIITTSSWRTGQQTVKRILGPAKKTISSATGRPQSSSSQDTDVSEPKSLNFQWKDEDDVKKGGKQMNGDADVRNGSAKVEASREKSPIHEEHVNGLNSDSELSQHSSGPATESEADVSEKDVKNLKGNKILSVEAKNILSDLELDTDDESEKEIEKAIPETKPKQSRVQKSSKRTKRKTPLNPQSQVSHQPVYPKQKVRHYDADEVKRYMAKKMAERKRKLNEEKLLKKRAVEEKKKKLEELYSRQKKNLQNNLHHKDKKSLEETYSKGRSDLRSILYPYNHPFHQDEVECYSEDTGVSESDKENLDIASFRGLPAYPAFERNGNGHHSLSSSPSGSMSPEPDQLSDREEKSQVPCVTSVSVGTKTLDIRPSAYVGFPEEKPRDEILATRSDLEPRSSSPNPSERNRPGAVPLTGNEELKLSGSPPREDRIAAIKQTAAQLKQRLETEAWRLGLNLQPTSPRKPDEQLGTLTSTSDYAVFKGALPGVDNLREQAELNQELDSMTSAATTIQAAFRGHSVRQGLNWKLPSDRTLRSTVREGLHQRPRISVAGASESSQYSTARDTVVPNEGNSSISDINTSLSSVRSNAHSPTHSSRSLKDDRPSSVRSPSLHESERRRKQITGHLSKQSRETKPSTLPWNSKGGDRLSVINIFTRRNPHLKFLPKEDESLDEYGSETGSLLEETLQDNRAGETASLLEPGADLDQSGGLLEQTLVEESPAKSQDHDEYDDDFTGSSHGDKREPSEKRTPSLDRRTDEPMYSETFESPENKTTSPKKSETLRSPNRSLESGPLSPTLSEGELSQASEAGERSPTFSSTRRSPPRNQETQSPLPPFAPPIHPPPSVLVSSHQGGDRLSPGSLDMRLAAELNRLEYMEESVRQLTDVERTRAVSMAQQETVSLAQILKSKQLSHARDMENLRAKAREEALEAAKQLEEARRAAADAAAGAAETIARVRLEAAANISESADRLVKVQSEAARTTAESAKHVEEARSSAARTLLDVARQQTADTRGVAADAASAAAEAAVKSTMARFHEQQEQLLREREARLKSYRDRSRDERTRDSYSSYSASERTPDSYSRTRTSRTGTDAVDRASQAKGSPGSRSYASDDLDITKGSAQDRTASVRTASNLSVDRSVNHSRRTLSKADPATRSKHAPSAGEESGSIPEEMEHSVADSVMSDIGLDVAEDDSLAEVLSGDNLKKPTERLERSPEEDYTLNFEESVMSSHTATDDEIDFRMILPSESHRRRSLGKTGRSGSIASDQGTVSYSSDDNHDSQDFPVDKVLEEFSAAPFSGEDSFSQFTSEMVRLMKEEEVRAKHQAGLLRLREKALKEKTRAEMDWLECQKQRHRDKGADDVMPSIRKRQRGVLMRLQAEQAEIKRLKAANRAASYERRLLLMQQEEIARLRKNTKKIREKAATEQTTHGQERGEKTAEQDFAEQPKSEAESTEIIEEFEEKLADHSTRSRSSVSEDIKTASPSASANASIAEDLASYQSPGASRTETRASNGHGGSGSAERKRVLSEGDSDEGSAKEGTLSASKGSPTASDSTVMQKLKKLKNQSSERYLTLREQKLMKRRKEAENLLEDKKKLLEWEKRLDKEESLVRNLLNEALSLESSRNKARTISITSEEEEHKDRSGRGSASPSASRSPSSKVSDKGRSPQRTESISESIKVSGSPGHERSASESSVPEDVSVSARDKSRDRSEKSHESSIPEVDMKTRSQGSSIPEEIPEEYVNDTFESLDSTATPAHSTPVRSDLSLKRDTSPAVSRRSSTGEGSKSEEETSMTETSDHSDIESRVRRLKDQLEVRKREVKRLYNERKKQRKAMLRAQETSLRQELQAVEMVISRTKAELNRPQTDSKRPETGSTEQRAVSTKSESSDTIPTREVRYHLSRTSDASGSRKYTPPDKPASVSVRSEPAGGRVSTTMDADASQSDRTISDVPSLKEKEKDLSSASGVRAEEKTKLSEKSESTLNKRVELDLTDRTRSPVESFSANRRQPSDSELKTSVRDRQDSEAEIEDEAKTAHDLSITEESEVQTVSKASYSEKSFEQRSQGSSKSLSVGRGKDSESDRKSSVRQLSDKDCKIPDEANTADDLSVSQVLSRSKSSLSKSDGLEKSKGDRSSIASDRKAALSEVSKSSLQTKSPFSSEKSRSSNQLYSSSFESVHDEEDKTEDDISEHISIEEDVKDEERSGVKDSVKDEVSTQLERDASKDGERTMNISEVLEEIPSTGNDRSDIKEDVPSTRKTVSVADEISSLASQKSVREDKNFLRPEKNEDQFPSYSADFERSEVDETDKGKSDNLIPQASYTPDFDASESNVSVDDVESFQQDEKSQDLSCEDDLNRDERLLSRDQQPPEIPVVQLEQVSDDESIAEELSESVEELEEIGDKEDSSNVEKHDLHNNENLERFSNEKESMDKNHVASVLPEVPRPEPQIKPSVDLTAERIVEDLSARLLSESMNCATSVLEKRRRTTEDLPKELAETHEERSTRLKKESRSSLQDDEDVISRSLDEPSEEEKISDHLSLSQSEESISGLDFRTKEREDLSPSLAYQPRQETREQQSNVIVNKLSDALLKEAASQMIAIMRTRQEKFAKAQEEQNTDSYTPPKGKIEDEPHSGEESPHSSPKSNRFMAVQQFPEGLLKYTEEISTPPGSPTSDQNSPIDEKELADKLDQLRRLHEHLDSARDNHEEGDDERLEFPVNTNTVIEFPAQDEDEEEDSFRRSRAASLLFSVPHRPSEVSPLVASSLSVFFQRKRQGLPIDSVIPPSEIIGEDEADDDLEANSKRVYRRLVFDLTGSLLKELLSEETPSNRPSWMKAKPRRKRRFHRGLQPLVHEQDFLPVVEQQLLNLIGLGDARPSLERVRRKTPLKAGKKDFVDAILIQELREDEPLWIDYDDDELAVKFQVADAIFESLLSETVMVVNAVQLRREARADVARS